MRLSIRNLRRARTHLGQASIGARIAATRSPRTREIPCPRKITISTATRRYPSGGSCWSKPSRRDDYCREYPTGFSQNYSKNGDDLATAGTGAVGRSQADPLGEAKHQEWVIAHANLPHPGKVAVLNKRGRCGRSGNQAGPEATSSPFDLECD